MDEWTCTCALTGPCFCHLVFRVYHDSVHFCFSEASPHKLGAMWFGLVLVNFFFNFYFLGVAHSLLSPPPHLNFISSVLGGEPSTPET